MREHSVIRFTRWRQPIAGDRVLQVVSHSAAFILIHYHCAGLLERAVAAILADPLDDLPAELIVVDNGSNERERACLRSLPVRIVENPANTGYAAGLNLGIAHTAADVLILMNPDVFLFPGCTSQLVNALRSGAAACGPRFYWDNEKTLLMPPTEERTAVAELASAVADRADRVARWARRRWRAHAHRHWLAQTPIDTTCLSGALIATRRDVFQHVGPFDEGFRLYFEEQDWLTRLSALSLRSQHVPSAEAVHLFNQSAAHEPRAQAWSDEAAARYATKHYPRWLPRAVAWARPHPPRLTQPTRLQPVPPLVRLRPATDSPQAAWVEVSPFARGFPAGAARVESAPGDEWTFPESVWTCMAPGDYFLTVCTRDGTELSRSCFERPPAPTTIGRS